MNKTDKNLSTRPDELTSTPDLWKNSISEIEHKCIDSIRKFVFVKMQTRFFTIMKILKKCSYNSTLKNNNVA